MLVGVRLLSDKKQRIAKQQLTTLPETAEQRIISQINYLTPAHFLGAQHEGIGELLGGRGGQ